MAEEQKQELNFQHNRKKDELTVEGRTFSGDFFRYFDRFLSGDRQIVVCEDGVIGIQADGGEPRVVSMSGSSGGRSTVSDQPPFRPDQPVDTIPETEKK